MAITAYNQQMRRNEINVTPKTINIEIGQLFKDLKQSMINIQSLDSNYKMSQDPIMTQALLLEFEIAARNQETETLLQIVKVQSII